MISMIAQLIAYTGDSSEGYFTTQPRRSTKRVSWSRVQCLSTPFDLCNLQLSTYQRSTLAFMEQFPAEVCSFDVTGRFLRLNIN